VEYHAELLTSRGRPSADQEAEDARAISARSSSAFGVRRFNGGVWPRDTQWQFGIMPPLAGYAS
jgi:hypothetical protein